MTGYYIQEITLAALVWLAAVHGQSETMNSQNAVLGPFRFGDQRNCFISLPVDSETVKTLVLPGFGFDNLQNKDLSQIYVHNFSLCKITYDRKFLIPNDVSVIPLKETNLRLFAEFFEHWDNYTSITSSSMNVGASAGFLGLSIDGKYSKEYKDVKTHQVHDQSQTTRTQLRNRVYAIHIDPAAQLHPTFKMMIYKIASYLQSNQTELAEYCAELLVRDYGTHFVSTIEVGAIFARVDHISAQYASQTRRQSLIYSASISFQGFQLFGGSGGLDLGLTRENHEEEATAYKQNRVASNLFTIGGPSITPDISISQWQEEVINNLAIIDRKGKPIHYAITPAAFPELGDILVWSVADTVQDSVARYFKLNTVKGCTDPTAANFDFQANLDDKSCNEHQAPTEYTLGGMYQRCSTSGASTGSDLCAMYDQINPMVGDYGCPQGYTSVLLVTGNTARTNVVSNQVGSCRSSSSWFRRRRRCRYSTEYSNRVTYAHNNAFWCVPLNRPVVNRELLFGGFYTRDGANPFTGDQSCPNHFIELRLGEATVVCVSSDYELGTVSSIKFGGFYSCITGNPLSPGPLNVSRNDPTNWQHNCPTGYAQHLISIEYNCAITVCLETGAFRSRRLLNARLPPFRSRPSLNEYGSNEGGLIIQGSRDNLLIKQTEGNWIIVKQDSPEALDFISSISNSTDDFPYTEENNATSNDTLADSEPDDSDSEDAHGHASSTAVVSLVISIMTVVIATVLAIIFGVRKLKTRRNRQRMQ